MIRMRIMITTALQDDDDVDGFAGVVDHGVDGDVDNGDSEALMRLVTPGDP